MKPYSGINLRAITDGYFDGDEIKRWTALRKSALALEIIQGKTTVTEATRAHDLPPIELEK